jgi:hypothetical protein
VSVRLHVHRQRQVPVPPPLNLRLEAHAHPATEDAENVKDASCDGDTRGARVRVGGQLVDAGIGLA